jgi:hypothetical protein
MSDAWKLDSRTVTAHLLTVLVEAGHHPYDVAAGVADFLAELGETGRAGSIDASTAASVLNASLPPSMGRVEEMEPPPVEVVRLPVEELELSMRALNACLANGVATAGELAATPPDEMRNWKNVGRKTIREIQEVLQNIGLGPECAGRL